MPQTVRPTGPAENASAAPGLQCFLCGYDLRGLHDRRCPECGTPFDPAEAMAPWGPLLWESSQPIPILRRLYRTLVGLVFHPFASLRQVGTVPRKLGRSHLLLLPWLLVLSAAIGLVTMAIWAIGFHVLDTVGKGGTPTPLSEMWLRSQLGSWDAMVEIVLQSGTSLAIFSIFYLLNNNEDPYRELAVLAGLFGVVLSAGLLAPAAEAMIPAIAVGAGTAGLVVYQFDRIDWPAIAACSIRGLIYILIITMVFGVYLTAADFAVTVANQWWGPSVTVRNAAARAESVGATGFLCLILYGFMRSAFRARRLRAVAALAVYALLDQMCLDNVEIIESPLTMLARHFALISYR